jgi:hypothetical protein
MKAVKMWMYDLPEGYWQRAMYNYNAQIPTNKSNVRNEGFDFGGEKADSMGEALIKGFAWQETQEGYTFWNMVCEHYENNAPMPPLEMIKKRQEI